MKFISTFFAAIYFISPIISAEAAIICPGSDDLEPYVMNFINKIKPAPYPQCYYTAYANSDKKQDNCAAIYENIKNNLLHERRINIKNWRCFYITDVNKPVPYDYTFTFAAEYLT
jgi:hypothetical protein